MKFRHQTITTPVVTLENRILHGITTLKNALTDATTAQSDAQLQAITALRYAFVIFASPDETPATTDTILLPISAQTCQSIRAKKRMLKQPGLQHPITPQTTPRVPTETAPCEPSPRVQI